MYFNRKEGVNKKREIFEVQEVILKKNERNYLNENKGRFRDIFCVLGIEGYEFIMKQVIIFWERKEDEFDRIYNMNEIRNLEII